jgi:hypothetical protein
MDWPTAAALGAAGGAVVEAISAWENLTTWQKDRHHARTDPHRPLPKLTAGYFDPLADTLVALTRLILGAAAGVLLHMQVTGAVAAIAVGAAAPALLRQLGTVPSMHAVLQRGNVVLPPVLSSLPTPETDNPPPRRETAE